MEIRLSVNIGASLQVRNAKGDWDWVKPEVGVEVSIPNPNDDMDMQQIFADMWDNIVGPQFKTVVNDLVGEQLQPANLEETTDEQQEEVVNADENSDDFIYD